METLAIFFMILTVLSIVGAAGSIYYMEKLKKEKKPYKKAQMTYWILFVCVIVSGILYKYFV